jgi:hypothetical protein
VVSVLAGWWCLPPRAVPARFPSRASEVRRCPNHFRRFETSRQVGGARWAHKQERARMAAASTYFGDDSWRPCGGPPWPGPPPPFLKCPPRWAAVGRDPRAPCFQLTLKKLQFLYFIGMSSFLVKATSVE